MKMRDCPSGCGTVDMYAMLGVAHNIHRSKFRIYTFFMLNDSVMRM